MNISRLGKNKHKILKSTSLDEIDGVFAGENFRIRYLGRTDVYENVNFNFEKTASEILAQYSKGSLERLQHFDLTIDSTFVVIRDQNQQRASMVLFNVLLSNVRNVLYLKKDKKYENICIFVAREAPQCGLKAHVLLCDSPVIAKKIFESFQNAFLLANGMNSEIKTKNLSLFKDKKKVTPDLNYSKRSSRIKSSQA